MTKPKQRAVSQESITYLREEIDSRKALLAALRKSPPPPKSTSPGRAGSQLCLHATTIKELRVARKYARAVFGTWSDSATARWQQWDGTLCTTFKNPKNNMCVIYLASPSIEEYPAELMSEHCKWVEQTIEAKPEKKTMEFVCKVPDAPTEG